MEYGERVEVKNVVPRKLQIKICRIFTSETDKDDLKTRLLCQNPWISQQDFEITRSYPIYIQGKVYTNLIANVSSEAQRLFIEKKNILFNNRMAKVFSHTPMLQCLACLNFGHIRRDCHTPHRCRYCAGSHNTLDCKETSMKNNSVCANFIRKEENLTSNIEEQTTSLKQKGNTQNNSKTTTMLHGTKQNYGGVRLMLFSQDTDILTYLYHTITARNTFWTTYKGEIENKRIKERKYLRKFFFIKTSIQYMNTYKCKKR